MIKNIILIALFALAGGWSQTVTVSGRVLSAENHEPLEGVNLYLKNAAMGTASNQRGNFRLRLPAGKKHFLIASYVGYAEKKIAIHARRDTSLTILLDRRLLDGPIVTAVATQVNDPASSTTYSEIRKEEFSRRYTTQDIPELLAELPSTTFYSEGGNGIGYNYLSIRGFDQRRIAVMINGVPQNDPEDHNVYWVNFPDLSANIQSIQSQRGAGNAFYGPAAIGGSINIKTDHFSPTLKLKADFGRGSFNTEKKSFYFNSGLMADHYLIYGRASQITSDGYRDRAWVDFKSFFVGAARYDKNSSLRLHFYGGPIRDGLVYNGLPKFVNNDDKLRRANWSYFGVDSTGKKVAYFGQRRSDETESFSQPHVELLHEWQINKDWQLNNTLFYINGKGYFDYDGSWGTPEYFRLTPAFGYDSSLVIPGDALIRAFVENNQVGWLPQVKLNSRQGEILIGAELRYHRSLHWGRLQKGSGLPAAVVGDDARRYYSYRGGKEIASLYYHQNYRWSDNINIQADMQLTYKNYRIFDEAFIGSSFNVPYLFINPRMGLNMAIDKNSRAYFSLYSTSREPRLKNLYDAAEASTPASWGAVLPEFELRDDGRYDFSRPLVKPETLSGIDLGYRLLRAWGNININLYYMDFINEIVKKGGLDRFGQPRTGNAERTLHYGIELSGRWNIMPQLVFSGNVTYSQNILEKYRIYDGDGREVDLSGNPIPGFPDLVGNGRLTYRHDRLYLSLIAKYVGAQYTDLHKDENNRVDAYTLLNLNGSYTFRNLLPSGSLQVYVQINNLLDRRYWSYGQDDEFFPGATRNVFGGLRYAFE